MVRTIVRKKEFWLLLTLVGRAAAEAAARALEDGVRAEDETPQFGEPSGSRDPPVSPSSRAPQRESPSRLAAEAAAQLRGAFDRKLHDGSRAWRQVRAYELKDMEHDGAIAGAIAAHLGVLTNKQSALELPELISDKTLEDLLHQVGGDHV